MKSFFVKGGLSLKVTDKDKSDLRLELSLPNSSELSLKVGNLDLLFAAPSLTIR